MCRSQADNFWSADVRKEIHRRFAVSRQTSFLFHFIFTDAMQFRKSSTAPSSGRLSFWSLCVCARAHCLRRSIHSLCRFNFLRQFFISSSFASFVTRNWPPHNRMLSIRIDRFWLCCSTGCSCNRSIAQRVINAGQEDHLCERRFIPYRISMHSRLSKANMLIATDRKTKPDASQALFFIEFLCAECTQLPLRWCCSYVLFCSKVMNKMRLASSGRNRFAWTNHRTE